MTTTNTFDAEETIAQIQKLEEAGCELVRVTVPKKEDVEELMEVRASRHGKVEVPKEVARAADAAEQEETA